MRIAYVIVMLPTGFCYALSRTASRSGILVSRLSFGEAPRLAVALRTSVNHESTVSIVGALAMALFRAYVSRRSHVVALASLLVSLTESSSGCKEAEAPRTNSNQTTQARPDDIAVGSSGVGGSGGATAVESAAIQVGPGFRYDPDDRIEGYEEFVRIRLGNALRIYYRGGWSPATLTLLDDDNNVLDSLRLDLPHVGVISGNLPATTPPCSKVRLAFVADGLATGAWERRIGVSAPELTSEMINELNKENQNPGSKSANSAVMLATHEATLDPTFGSIHIVACDAKESQVGVDSANTYTGNFVGDHPRSAEGHVSDEAWLPRRVRDVFDELRKSSTPSDYDTSSAAPIRCLLSDVIATDELNRGVESAQNSRVYYVAAGLDAKGELEPFNPSFIEAIGLSQVRSCEQVANRTEEVFLIYNIRWQSRDSVTMDFAVLVPKMLSYDKKDPGKWVGGAGSTGIRLVLQNDAWQLVDRGASWVQ